MDSLELKVNRKNTKAFIAENPETLVITSAPTKEPDGAGGSTTTPGTAADPQDFRMIIQGGNVASRNIDGEQVKPAFVLIGEWDAVIGIGSTFKHNGRNYEVMYVREDHDYETWVEVVYRG